MRRREFLMSAAAVAAAGLARPITARAAQLTKQAALDRISIMSLNFDAILKAPDRAPSPTRDLDLFDLPTMLADTYGTHKVEYQHYHLASLEDAYLKDIKKSLDKAKAAAQQINLEFSGLNISAPMKRDRLLAIDLTKTFVDHAVTIGAKRVMINQGTLTPENKAYAIETLRTMVNYGKSKNIIVSVETRGGGGGNRGRAAGAAGGPAPATGAAPAAPAPAAAAPPAAPAAGQGTGAAFGAGRATTTPATFEGTPLAPGPPTWMLLAEVIEGPAPTQRRRGAAAPIRPICTRASRMFVPANTMHTRTRTGTWPRP